MQNFKQPGELVTLTAPSGGVTVNLGVQIGQLFVVATSTVAQTLSFVGRRLGIVELVKDAGTAWTEGELLYWDDSAKNVVDASGTTAGKLLIGSAAEAVGSAVLVGKVILNGTARPDGVSDNELEDNAVDTAAIQDLAVTTGKLALLAVDTAQLAADAVDGDKIEDSAVDTEHIAALAVETAELADDAVTAAKIDMVVSGELTGSGSEQDFVHGLGGTPSVVLAILTGFTAVTVDIAYGTHDGTNTKVTITNNVTYKLLVIL